MKEQLTARLEELRKDYEAGENRLQMLESEANRLRETLLRISGAIQVLQELLDSSGQGSNGAASESAPDAAQLPRVDAAP